jgi:hypothetical protein
MAEQTVPQESTPANKAKSIARQIFQWVILGLLLFTCIMAAYRKFGGWEPKPAAFPTSQNGGDVMTGMSMSPIFGVFFALVGLALAVLVGLFLYQDKKPSEASDGEPFKIQEKGEAVWEADSLREALAWQTRPPLSLKPLKIESTKSQGRPFFLVPWG